MMTDTAEATQFVRVWFGARFVGLFVDWLIFAVLWMVVGSWAISTILVPSLPPTTAPGAFPGEMFMVFSQLAWAMVTVNLLVFAYFVIMETWLGATLGKKMAGIRTVDLANPGNVGLPFGKAVLRELVKVAGFIPALVFFIGGITFFASMAASTTSLEAMEPMLAWLGPVQFVAQILPLVWLAWIGISLVNNRDPIYDRVAGTAVVRA